MIYIDSVIEPGETVRCRATVSRIIYVQPLVLCGCSAMMFALASHFHKDSQEFLPAALLLA